MERDVPNRNSVEQAVTAALGLLHDGRQEEASAVYGEISAMVQDHPAVLYLGAEVAISYGQPANAAALLERVVALVPDSVMFRLKLADIQMLLKQRLAAMETATEAALIAPEDGRALWAAARILARGGNPQAACELYKKAAGKMQEPALLYDLGVSQFFSGDSEGAEKTLSTLLRRSPQTGHAAYLRALVGRQTNLKNHLDELRGTLAHGSLEPADRAAYPYAESKELEDIGEHDASFASLVEGARLKHSTLSHDPVTERNVIDSIREVFTREALDRIPCGHGGENVIFIVGMPRTGTTLLEHLITRHGRLPSAGELPDFGDALRDAAQRSLEDAPGANLVDAARLVNFRELGEAYLSTARQVAGGQSGFIDKMPINFMYCGLIAKALPRARILHLVRNPMDTCYAVFKTLFSNAYPFSYDQAELAEYYVTYSRLMQHWHSVLPESILDVRYENLVTDPDGEIHRVLDWCGLAWQPAGDDAGLGRASMTASAMQVREPVHTTSVGKWARHANGLNPLRTILEAKGIVLD